MTSCLPQAAVARIQKSSFQMDWDILTVGSVIGCTVLTAEADPHLSEGIAVTVLVDYDDKRVKFVGIEQSSPLTHESSGNKSVASHRYWNDVYLLIPYDTAHRKPLQVDDKVFALFQNEDLSFSTVYYQAIIVQIAETQSAKITVKFLGNPKNISMQLTPQTLIGNVSVPTVIRRCCAKFTNPYFHAISHKNKQNTNNIKQTIEKSQNEHKNNNVQTQTAFDYNININEPEEQKEPPQKKQKIVAYEMHSPVPYKCNNGASLREHTCIPCGHYLWICICDYCIEHNIKQIERCPIAICQEICRGIKRS